MYRATNVYSNALNVLIKFLFAQKAPNYEGSTLCVDLLPSLLSSKMSRTRFRIRELLVLRETCAQDLSTHLCQ